MPTNYSYYLVLISLLTAYLTLISSEYKDAMILWQYCFSFELFIENKNTFIISASMRLVKCFFISLFIFIIFSFYPLVTLSTRIKSFIIITSVSIVNTVFSITFSFYPNANFLTIFSINLIISSIAPP